MTDTAHYLESRLRESILEHVFTGDVLRCLWRHGIRDIEVLRAEVDRGGYDLVFEANRVMRHIQLKGSYRSAKTRDVSIHSNLATKTGGCVIWILFDPGTMEQGPFLWFGGHPGDPLPELPDRVARHTRGARNERPSHRILPRSRFDVLQTIDEVVTRLFGLASTNS
ncbi:hypothetical protein [Microbaculum sp. FT89]|uniref:hypothetical protein n=1 Tax=Microbaculum sp. FT89 TaxID=3447298 RepID=UPI003F52EC6B